MNGRVFLLAALASWLLVACLPGANTASTPYAVRPLDEVGSSGGNTGLIEFAAYGEVVED